MRFMKIINAEFVKGIRGTDSILGDPRPQIAFIGRSNVGKSSVINSLVGRKDLVKTSSLPGKTREANFFSIRAERAKNKEYYFVDLPGYGFAKLPIKQQEKLRKLIMWYLTYGEVKPRRIVLITDIKVAPTKFDMEMIEILRNEKHDFLIVANKSDKLNQKDLARQLKKIKAETGVEDIIVYSAKTKKGKEELLKEILK